MSRGEETAMYAPSAPVAHSGGAPLSPAPTTADGPGFWGEDGFTFDDPQSTGEGDGIEHCL